ncbi:MAG: peptidase S8, partial [Acidobacteriota bacterium]
GLAANPQAVRNAILKSAIDCNEQPIPDCRRLLAGRINIIGALNTIKEGVVVMSEKKRTADEQAIEDAPVVTSESSSSSKHLSWGVTSNYSSSIIAAGNGPTCSCGSTVTPSLIYAFGHIGYDFGTEARRDSFLQQSDKNLLDPLQFLAHLKENLSDASSIIWTLNLDSTPIYAIQPTGPFAFVAYERLREFLKDQLEEGAERVSLPGIMAGKVTLLSGQVVPIIYPEVRGMYSWSTSALIKLLLGNVPEDQDKDKKLAEIKNFLERVYFELRNFGLTSQERAMNYAATNAFQLKHIYSSAIEEGMKLDTIDIERSPICRPGADCWDVKLTFFNPLKRLEQARLVYRFTIDVSDTIPVTVGKVRSWHVY